MDVNEKSSGGSFVAPKSKYEKDDLKFCSVSVDNFFDNPDKIVKYAKSLSKEPHPDGDWPGKRTKPLWKINKELNQVLMMKILSCFYDFTYQDMSWETSNLYFQEIPAFSKNKNDVKNRGWIHSDEPGTDVAGLVYLTPGIDPDSGTSLFTWKNQNDNNEYMAHKHQFAKHLLYSEGDTVDEDYYIKKIKRTRK